jgi:SAM-dependent methyltransferase
MSDTPRLFDQRAIRMHLRRAARANPADFLRQRAVADANDRLAVVMRRFERCLDYATPGTALSQGLVHSPTVGSIIHYATDGALAGTGPWLTVQGEPGLVPFGHESLDLVVSLFALQTIDDLPGTLIQLRRALRPDGLFLACLLGGDSLLELRQAFAEAEAEIEGGISPRVAPFADVRRMGALLQRAGFALPVTDADTITVRYNTVFNLMADLRAMGATNPLVDRRRAPTRWATLARMAEIYHERFSDPDGRVRATFEIIWVSGWAPHESQQKPLKPGSAQMRLADALRTPPDVDKKG